MEKKVDVCCHCGKKVGGYYVSPEGYYYLGASFIGCSSVSKNNKDYRLCVDCFKIFKEVVGGFFKTEEEVKEESPSCENCKHWGAELRPCDKCYEFDEWEKIDNAQ